MSNASHAKEPSMEEILASIRKIIESGDERTGLPGLSLEPRHRRVAAKPPASALASDAFADESARIAPDRGDRGDRGDRAAEPGPARLFQPANGIFAESGPFEEPATWEFSPSAAADLEPARGPAAMPVIAGSAAAAASTATIASAIPSTSSSSAIRRPLAEAFGTPRLPARLPSEPAEVLVVPAVEVVGESEAEPSAASGVLDDPARVVPVCAPAEKAFSAGPEPSHALRLETAPADEPAARAELPDFSLEFEEADFAAALLDEVDRDAGGEADAFTVPSAHADIWPAEAVAVPQAGDNRNEPATVVSDSRRSVMAETSSLISVEAGAQVAAAFDDLARAIRDGHMKSMEQMAREMLRPMLQEWLDDNLPRLVEKLVREEIERVARGGRR